MLIFAEIVSGTMSAVEPSLEEIFQMCKPIHMGGESKRTVSGKQKMPTLKEVFSKGGRENE